MIADVTRQPGKYLYSAREGVTEAGASLSRRIPAGELILSNSGTVCVPKILKVDGCIHDGFIAFPTLKERVVLDFAYYWFEFVRPTIIQENRQGVTQVNLNTGIVREMHFPLAPLDEQRRIVAEIEKQFTRLEAGVAALRRVQAGLKRYRAAVLKADCEGRLVPTESDWEETTLGEVSTVLAGYGFPERLQGRTSGDLGFFKVGDISAAWQRNQKVLTQANHYISNAEAVGLRAKPLPAGTVVFAKIGAAIALNRRAILGQRSLVDNNVMGLGAGDRINPKFLFHFVCTLKLDELARATTVPSIRKGDVEGIALRLPPLAEQQRIVTEVERRLSVIEELETVVSANLQRAIRLRQSILQQAFVGNLR